MEPVKIIGAGLAGCEAAWQLAQRGIPVELHEMKPEKMTPAHHSPEFAELVCSNSLRSDQLENAVGLLKEELRRCGSLIMSCADAHRVEAGGALAVDRRAFSQAVTQAIRSHPAVTVVEGEGERIPEEGQVIVAAGPLASDALTEEISRLFPDSRYLNFFDAAAPLVTFESVNMERAWFASRYDRGTPDYINCPMEEEEYQAFWEALTTAQEAEVHGFEDSGVFEGCMPVEVMARRGRDLKWPEQKRVVSMIPGLERAEFVRYGVMHRNTYLDSPRLLDRYYRVRGQERIMFAGQITGVEGYVESTASGALAAMELARRLEGKEPINFPRETAMGAMALYISDQSVVNFQPMNVNFGLIPPLGYRVKGKRNKNAELSKRALEALGELELS